MWLGSASYFSASVLFGGLERQDKVTFDIERGEGESTQPVTLNDNLLFLEIAYFPEIRAI